MLIFDALRRRLRAEQGFTLVEVLVASVTSVVVLGAAFEVFTISLHQASRISDYVQATQNGRTTMTHIVDELHSACLGPSATFRPIQEKSSPSTLIFIDAFSSKAVIEPSEVQKHEIIWSSEHNGSLTDKTYAGVSGEWPTYTFSATPSVRRIGENIVHSTEKGSNVPIFKYYKFNTETTSTSTSGESALKEIPLASETEKLSSTQAKEVASVLISFRSRPTNGREQLSRSLDLTSQVIFSFSVSVAEPKIEDSPCT